jgi:hypothetical protein
VLDVELEAAGRFAESRHLEPTGLAAHVGQSVAASRSTSSYTVTPGSS